MKILPKKLYKYRPFNINSLRLLSRLEVYYANPCGFNDPLDCNPSIQVDTDIASLEKLYIFMMITTHGKEQAEKNIRTNRYNSSQYGNYKTDLDAKNYYMSILASEINGLLKLEIYSQGVLSLAERWNCPLMWSHYADEHRGLCIEYDMTENACSHIKPVDYQRPRSIKVSDLIQWKLHKSTEAKERILDTYFFAKAPPWQYEREWRDIHTSNGVQPASFKISGIYFGLRCDSAVEISIIKLFANSHSPISFYELCLSNVHFRLKRRRIDTAEIEAHSVRTTPIHLEFKDVFLDDKGYA